MVIFLSAVCCVRVTGCGHRYSTAMDRKEILTPSRKPVQGAAGVLLAVLALVVSMAASTANAAPAQWYWWVSKVDGQRVCAQYMPAQGWERGQGPYASAQCRK